MLNPCNPNYSKLIGDMKNSGYALLANLRRLLANLRKIAAQLFDKLLEKTNSKHAHGLSLKQIQDLQAQLIALEKQIDEFNHANDHAEASHEKYLELYDLAPLAYFTLSNEGKVKDLNHSGSLLIGKDVSKITDSPFASFVSPDSKPIFDLFLSKVLSSRSKETCEVMLSADNNQVTFVQLTGIAADNRLCLLTAVDVTSYKRDQADKEEDDFHLRETQTLARLGTYSVDLDSGKWSSSMILDEIFGIDSNFDKSFKNWSTILHPEWQKVLKNYFVDDKIGKSTDFDKEYKIVRKNDKSIRWVHGIGHLKLNEKNLPTALVGTIQDITERKKIEQDLYESETKYRELIENSMVGVFKSKVTEEVIYANDACLKLLGYDSFDELVYVGSKVRYKYPQQRRELIELIKKDGHVEAFEASFLTRNGEERVVLMSILLKNEIMNGTLIDITDRRKAENELVIANEKADESSARFRSYIDFAPDGVFVTDEEGNYLEVNPGATLITGYSKEELLRMSYKDLLPPFSQSISFNPFGELLKSGVSKGDIEFIHKNGEVRWWSVEGVKLSENRILGFVRDITERKKAEKTLQISEERYRRLVDNIDVGVVVHGQDSSILSSNPKASELLGLSIDQMKGKLAIDPEWKFLGKDNAPLPFEQYPIIQITSSKKQIKNFVAGVYRPVTKDVVWLMINGFPVLDADGQISEIVISFIDITGLKRLEVDLSMQKQLEV